MIDAGNGTILAAAAFGGEPGSWPLPSATGPCQLWLRAVAAGGQGRFASARADLTDLLRSPPSGSLASLAHSTRGSFLRQLGWHSLARGQDGTALRLAGDDPEAIADALVGLAADALGAGRLAAAAALLARTAGLAEPDTGLTHRLAVRRAWVTAELAMAAGDADTAVRQAGRAIELTHGAKSRRHGVKSEVVLAAALCCAGRVVEARAVADTAVDTAGELGLIPLRWAAACLLADIGSVTYPHQQVIDIRNRCAQLVRQRGGSWRQR